MTRTTVRMIDAHLHVWRAAPGPTPGITTLVSPQTDVPLDAARDVMASNTIERAVLVQPVFRGQDNRYVAECARAEPARFAAVCVVDPCTPGAAERLEHWVHQGCRGLRLRPRIAAEESIFGDPATYPLWEAAARLGVVVSLLCGPAHLRSVAALAARFPDVSIVVDHLGHPDPAVGTGAAAFRELLDLARQPRVFVKLSGFYHFSDQPFPFPGCWDLIRAVYEHFGPGRLVWGSDFPHVAVTCGYANHLRLPEMALANWSPADREAVMGGNALALYWPDASS